MYCIFYGFFGQADFGVFIFSSHSFGVCFQFAVSTYHQGVFRMRNEWMVDHSNRVIVYYNGTHGGTRNTIEYAEKKMIEVVMLQEQAEESTEKADP